MPSPEDQDEVFKKKKATHGRNRRLVPILSILFRLGKAKPKEGC